jgi:hypothetical protein
MTPTRLNEGQYFHLARNLNPTFVRISEYCKAHWLLYVPPELKLYLKNLYSAYTLYLCVLFGSQKKPLLLPLYNINLLVLIT